ncbi:hypothetical protein BT93_L5425, partial [Corymbia citriodora subsp. variegata]
AKPFKAEIPEEAISELKQLLKLSKVAPVVYENQQHDRKYGVTRDWLVQAKKHWETDFDWREHEKYINSFPNYTVPIKDDEGYEFTIHFAALFSEKEDAIPIAFYHGWPGSFLEFLPMMDHIRKTYSPKDLPYHIIVPSLPGYTYSSGPPTDRNYTIDDAPIIMNKLMCEIGFESGYLAQGGDLGSSVARFSAVRFDACKGFHLNMMQAQPPPNSRELPMTDLEAKFFPRGKKFSDFGSAYAREHGTRTATIGFALSSSPLALLAWIGEKFLEWTDEDPPLDKILESVTLYWLTDTFPRCIYPYRSFFGGERDPSLSKIGNPQFQNDKPMGFSWFPYELGPIPKSWIEKSGNLVSFAQHESGGHFAAMEKPEVLFKDVEEFVKVAWKK